MLQLPRRRSRTISLKSLPERRLRLMVRGSPSAIEWPFADRGGRLIVLTMHWTKVPSWPTSDRSPAAIPSNLRLLCHPKGIVDFDAILSRDRVAQISQSFNGGFCLVNLAILSSACR